MKKALTPTIYFGLLVAMLSAASTASATALPISQLVVFGDSLSDNGNAAIALGGTLPGNYAPNAFTDGPATTPATSGPFGLWIDQFAGKLGVADPQPFLAGGTNFAVASALAGHNPLFTLPPTVVPFTSDQVAIYLLSHTPSVSTLFTFWAGANDIDAGRNPVTAADNIEANIKTLAAAGATRFVWLNLPPLGATPDGLASGQSALLNAASGAFDVEWAADISALRALGIDVSGVDVAGLFAQIASNPSGFGFTDITDSAWCGPGGLATCAANNPNHFLYWDGEHPTTAADSLVATLAFNDVTATPEPGAFSLSLIGFCSLAFSSARLRRIKFRAN
ncbi:MAG TPA: SGNH/GDSL hydrolase family protein [Candidatus Sulfotelmatobacter sp.]|nr:SGNH/GDSL hydrolase family protein [Candidatus Sulfotelmatobacter sp.]